MYIDKFFIFIGCIVMLVLGYIVRDIFENRQSEPEEDLVLSREISSVRQVSLTRSRNSAALFTSKTSASKKTEMTHLNEDDEIVITFNKSYKSFDVSIYSKFDNYDTDI